MDVERLMDLILDLFFASPRTYWKQSLTALKMIDLAETMIIDGQY